MLSILLVLMIRVLGVSNIAMSFGGSWLEGDRIDINNWQNSLGSFNVDSKRIPKMMYDVMSNRGTCVATSSGDDVPEVVCSNDSDW